MRRRLGPRPRRTVAIITVVVATLGAWLGWRGYRAHVGSPAEALSDTSWVTAVRVLARDGELLGERPSRLGLRGIPTKLEDVSERLVRATIASEDHRFFEHDGVDRVAIVRAFFTNLRHGHIVSGGSTISQQLVKRLDYQGQARPRTLGAKVREIARAQNLTRERDKRTLLEAYLNRLDYGRGFAGPEAAALGYFGVHALDLSLAQATLLAVLPRAPTALDPYRHKERAVARQRALLDAMRDAHLIEPEDAERAKHEPLVMRDPHAPKPFFAPHVVLEKAGRTTTAERVTGEVRTTLSFSLQRDTEAFVRTHAVRFAKQGASTAAVVVVDNLTGEVLASVGSAAYLDARIAGAVDAVRARRQPGSTLKPFVYAMAFEAGVSPMQMLADVPTDFGEGAHAYAPDNFDGTFAGPISAREALAGSLNVPAVRLAAELGASNVITKLRASGLMLSGGAERLGVSVALGSGEVSPLELAEAYATLARGGVHIPLREQEKSPRDREGPTTHVFERSAVASVADALSDPFARIRGLRTRGPFEFPYPVAVKTGTSTAYRDAWTAGFTRERTVVVWVGNADGSPTRKLTGAVGAGPLFFDVMTRAMRDVTVRAPLYDEDTLEQAEVCPLSGQRPASACPDHVMRRFPRGHAPTTTCTLHQHAFSQDGANRTPPFRCSNAGDKTIVLLPQPFSRWLADRKRGAPGADPHGLPWLLAESVPGCAEPSGEEPRISLVEPRDGAVFHAERASAGSVDALDVQVETRGLPRGEPLEVLIDGRLAMRLDHANRARVPVRRGDHLVEVRPTNADRRALLGRAHISVR